MRPVLFLLLLVLNSVAFAASVEVRNLRMWPAPDSTRLVFDITDTANYRVFSLDKPNRLVIDIRDTKRGPSFKQPAAEDRMVRRIRSAPRKGKNLRVVLDLKRAVTANSFLLEPNKHYGHRLVVDLRSKTPIKSKETAPVPTIKSAPENPRRDVVIAIDAGHGGEDPGAQGYQGTYEKTVVLHIARELAKQINSRNGMRAVLVRNGDYYVGLRKRMQIARREKADLFISIHADAFMQPQVRGSSVYVLSRRGASSEAARWLAAKENASDLVGGVPLRDKDDLLASVLLDLSQTASLEASNAVAKKILRHMKSVGKTHKKTVQHAAFAVLKSPDIPSLLIETAFISNPYDEKNLLSKNHRRKMAAAIMKGLEGYFSTNPPPGTLLAEQRRHVIARGDTLSELASQYGVSQFQLKSVNSLKGDTLRLGAVLTIPGG